MRSPDYCGWGAKQGSKVRTWKNRFFVLRGRELAYYGSAGSGAGSGEKGRLRVVNVDYAPDRKNGLLIHGEKKNLKMTTANAEESRVLFRKIKQAIGEQERSFRDAPQSTSVECTLEGWLLKKEPHLQTWKRRYVTLSGNVVTYYADQSAPALGSDVVMMVAADAMSPLSLRVTAHGGLVVHLAAETREEIERWDRALAKATGKPLALGQAVENQEQETRDASDSTAKTCEGWLEKLGQRSNAWKKRYFVLSNGMLEYRKGPMEQLSAEIFVTDVKYSSDHPDALEIEFGADHSLEDSDTICVRAESIRDLDQWMCALCDAVGKPRLQPGEMTSQPSSPSSDGSAHERLSKPQSPPFPRNASLPQDRRTSSTVSNHENQQPASPANADRSSAKQEVVGTGGRHIKRGWLYKQGYRQSSWKLRYFVLDGNVLRHYKHVNGASNGQGVVTSVAHNTEPAGSLGIQLDDGSVLNVYGETKADTEAWYAAMCDASWNLAENLTDSEETTSSQYASDFSEDNAFRGWLLKKGQNFKTWKRRYFVLERSRLAYSAAVDGEVLGSGVVFEVAVGELRPFCIDIRFQNGRLLHAVAPTEEAFSKWVDVLQKASNLAESFLMQSRGKIVFDEEFDHDGGDNADVDFTPEDIAEYDKTIREGEGASLWIAAMENKPLYDDLSSSDSEHDDKALEGLQNSSPEMIPRASDTASTVSQSKGCVGWLKKEGGNVKSWKRRYFTLYDTKLSYYKSEKGSLLRSVHVAGISERSSVALSLDISTASGRKLIVQADSREDFDKWVLAIRGALADAKGRQSSVLRIPAADKILDTGSAAEDDKRSVSHSGWLEKEGQRFKSWKRRYFTFKNGALIYYCEVGGVARGHGMVSRAELDDSKPRTLAIEFRSGKVMRVTAADDAELDSWHQVLSRGRSSSARTTACSDVNDDVLDSDGEEEEEVVQRVKRLDSNDYFPNDTITNDSFLRLKDQEGKSTFLQSFDGSQQPFKGELRFDEDEEEKEDLGVSTAGVDYYRELVAEDERVQEQREADRLAHKGEAPIAGCAPCCIVM
ncbi:hypothetical protein BBJ28_00010232 [Nothophytophthora sp. Chile5]|nr:hypothetical protein BBJ28_00010232 [Nothophytophthora sp. Chile5]